MMACIMMVVIPIVIMYILCQKYIIDGVGGRCRQG